MPTTQLAEVGAGVVGNMTKFKVGDKYQITGGKFKKYKFGTLVKINPTYSDVSIDCGDPAPFLAKVKNCYLLACEPSVVIEMPTADDLVVVENLPEEPDGTLEINEIGEEVDNITHTLPTINEALKLRQDHLKTLGEMLALQQKHEGLMEYNKHLEEVINLIFQSAYSCDSDYDGKIDELITQVKPSDWKEKYEDLLHNRGGQTNSDNLWKINAIKKILE